jgi:hypothetical protein
MKEGISTCDKAIAILQATSDGDKLAPVDLSLVESAVNGFITSEGIEAFNKLHKTVAAGEYKQPWFHGIEKGTKVEHYEQPWAYSKDAKESAQELKRRCEILESKGISLNITTVIWKWVDGE